MSDPVLKLLEASRTREKEQTLFYRGLAASAELAGEADLAERFNELHADEQHHLSRLTARMLELGASPEALDDGPPEIPSLGSWEGVARRREEGEVEWYGKLLEADMDPTTRGVLDEIRASEVSHARELGGKWMPA